MIKSGNKEADTILIFVIVAAIVYLVYKITKVVADPVGAAQEAVGITPDTNLPSPANLPVNTENLTHPKSQFDIWAVQLYDSIWGFFAEKQTIREIMYQINSDDDLKQIIKSYGIQTSLFGLVGGSGALTTHLRDVMSQEDIDGFNSHFEGWNMTLRI